VSAEAVLRLEDLTLGYEGHPAVHHLSGTFSRGSMTAIVGPNGSGKSTLCKGIMGLIRPLGGRVERIGVGADGIAYLPQAAEIDRSFPTPVADLVALGLWRRCGPFSGLSATDRAQIEAALKAVGLEGFAGRGLDTLSGGQMQRALFARLLLQDAQLILLDEPFAALDAKTISDLLDLIRRWHGERRTILIVLHDLDLARSQFPETLLLAREAVAWGPTKEVLTPENLLKARQMCEAFDRHAEICATDAA
jgi:zinc/manganese transport system ATP-binding protein